MKKMVAILLLVSMVLAHAGHQNSKSSSNPDSKWAPLQRKVKPSEKLAQLQTSVDECSSQLKPFAGKHWSKVHITPDHFIYTFDGRLKSWNFDGSLKTICKDKEGYMRSARATFTDEQCYLHAGTIIDQYSMKKNTLQKRVIVEDCIEDLSANTTGFATIAFNCYVNYFDLQAYDPQKIKIKTKNEIGKRCILMDSSETGELYCILAPVVGRGNSLYKVDVNTSTTKELINTEGVLRDLCKKKTFSGHLILARRDQSCNSIVIADPQEGKTISSFKISHCPNLMDVDQNTLAIAGDENGGNRIKLYDIETGQSTYKGTVTPISGECALQLANGQVYFVGSRPEPRSMIIDTREKAD